MRPFFERRKKWQPTTNGCFHAPPKQLERLTYRRALCGAGLGCNFRDSKNGKTQEYSQQNSGNRRLGSCRLPGNSWNLLKETENGF